MRIMAVWHCFFLLERRDFFTEPSFHQKQKNIPRRFYDLPLLFASPKSYIVKPTKKIVLLQKGFFLLDEAGSKIKNSFNTHNNC